MKDVQSERDARNIEIDKVGVSGISWPVTVMDRENGTQETVAEVSLSVLLPH
ncbi:MAG: GTP cyclohydrolase, FolE2/MptA family, partial [Synergistaceae bacterium]|nr:GTP cyclohydrolase, FolE2/MptA family [Synergistaceae bacterium]